LNDVAVRPERINIISLCSGGGGLDVGVELAMPSSGAVLYVERESFAVAHLVAAIEQGFLAPAPIWSDVSAFDGRAWRGLVDGLIGGIPCFAAGTMVLTKDGYRPIEELRIGDLVLSHKGRWKPINHVMARDGAELWEVRAQGVCGVITTAEHPFLSVSERGDGIDHAEWRNAEDLRRGHRLAQVLPPERRSGLSNDVLWLLGRFLADGWTWDRRVTGNGNPCQYPQGCVVIACNDAKKSAIEECAARAGLHVNWQHERTAWNGIFFNQEFWKLCSGFGKYAHGKFIPGWALELPPDQADALLSGYLAGDGHRAQNRGKWVWRANTVSKSLAYGIALLVQRAKGIVAGIKLYRPAPTKLIEGRLCNQRPWWSVDFYESGNRSAYIDNDGYGWKYVWSSQPIGETGTVYNIGVEGDESYVADGAIVHNCQPWSNAGKRLGTDDERDLWAPTRRIIAQARPFFVFIENVSGMLSPGGSSGVSGAERVRRDLHRLGFKVEAGLFTASEVGASHERERLFILGVADSDIKHGDRAGFVGARRGRQPSDSGVEVRNVGLADADDAGLERYRESIERSGECVAGSGSGELVDASGNGWREGWAEPAVRSGRDSSTGTSDAMGDAIGSGYHGRSDDSQRRPQQRTLAQGAGREADGSLGDSESERGWPVSIQPGRPLEAGADIDGTIGSVADADIDATRRNGRTVSGAEAAGEQARDQHRREPDRSRDGSAAVADSDISIIQRQPSTGELAVIQQDDGISLFPPGPGDAEAWRYISEFAPERLPAISSHDRFMLTIRAALIAADGDPTARERLDPKGPYGLRAEVVQAIAQSCLRGMDDGLAASRIDWLRLLGNGVVPLQAAAAFRTLASRLAGRGSCAAAQLVRMMEQA